MGLSQKCPYVSSTYFYDIYLKSKAFLVTLWMEHLSLLGSMKLIFICVFIAMFLNHFRPVSLRLLVVGPRHCQCPHLKISNWEKPDRVCLWLYWSATSYHIFIIYSIIHCIKKLKFNFRSCSCTHFGCRMPKDCLWRGQYFV